jgi:hypothetical protein
VGFSTTAFRQDDQIGNTSIVTGVMCNERYSVKESCGGNPGISTLKRMTGTPSHVADLRPLSTEIVVHRMENELANIGIQTSAAFRAPVALKRLPMKFRHSHEGDNQPLSVHMRTISFGSRVILEQERDDIGIYDDGCDHAFYPAVPSRRHSLSAATNSSTLSSEGQKSPNKASKSAGFTCCSSASISRCSISGFTDGAVAVDDFMPCFVVDLDTAMSVLLSSFHTSPYPASACRAISVSFSFAATRGRRSPPPGRPSMLSAALSGAGLGVVGWKQALTMGSIFA